MVQVIFLIMIGWLVNQRPEPIEKRTTGIDLKAWFKTIAAAMGASVGSHLASARGALSSVFGGIAGFALVVFCLHDKKETQARPLSESESHPAYESITLQDSSSTTFNHAETVNKKKLQEATNRSV